MLEIFTFLQKLINLEHKTQHAVFTHANTSDGIKIPTFFGKSWADDVILVQCPFNILITRNLNSIRFCSEKFKFVEVLVMQFYEFYNQGRYSITCNLS